MPSRIAPRLSRRALLKTGLLGTVLVGVGSGALLLQRTKLRAPQGDLRVLDLAEYAVLCALADRVCPPMGAFAPGASALNVASLVDESLVPFDADTKSGVKIGLRIFESALTGALLAERITPFTQLSPEAQDAQIESWRRSSLRLRRSIFVGLSTLIEGTYWGLEETWKPTGYPGPPSVQGLRDAYADNLVDWGSLRQQKAGKEG